MSVAVKSYRARAWIRIRSSTGGGEIRTEHPEPDPDKRGQDEGVTFHGPVTQGKGSSFQVAGRDQNNVWEGRRRKFDG